MIIIIEVDQEIYSRNKDINLHIPDSVCIIGVGGVGGWVAFKFALVGVNNIIMVDPDKLEEHNLNRLPYKYDQIGEYKVHAMEELIRERRMCNIFAYPMNWEDIPKETRDRYTADRGEECSIIIDCRDSFAPLEGVKETFVNGGYDGGNLTINIFPEYEHIWGDDDVRYRITPSYLIPPDFISNMIVNFVCYEMHESTNPEKVRIEESLTIDVRDMYDTFRRGVKHREMELSGIIDKDGYVIKDASVGDVVNKPSKRKRSAKKEG